MNRAKAEPQDEADNDVLAASEIENFFSIPHSVKTVTVDYVLGQIEKKEIVLHPEYQRDSNVWSYQRKSRLVESLLMHIVMPNIYLANTGEEIEVMDGLQRLTTLTEFVRGDFALSNLSVLPDRGNKFQDLSKKSQRAILTAPVVVIEIGSDENPIVHDMKLQTFVRLQGGASLNAIEIIHASYPGKFMQKCKEMAYDEQFVELFGLRTMRMKNLEFFLMAAVYAFTGQYNTNVSNIFDDMRRLCSKMVRNQAKLKGEMEAGFSTMHHALKMVREAMPYGALDTFEKEAKTVAQSKALVIFCAACDVIAENHDYDLVKFKAAVAHLVEERIVDFIGGGANSKGRFEAIMRHAEQVTAAITK